MFDFMSLFTSAPISKTTSVTFFLYTKKANIYTIKEECIKEINETKQCCTKTIFFFRWSYLQTERWSFDEFFFDACLGKPSKRF